MYVVEIKFFVF